MLRMDRVANIPGIQPGARCAPLAEIYIEFEKTRQLSDDEVRHIVALERSEKTPAIYRSNNLLDVYKAYVQLSRLIKTGPDASPLSGRMTCEITMPGICTNRNLNPPSSVNWS